jgi:hypothetical protein
MLCKGGSVSYNPGDLARWGWAGVIGSIGFKFATGIIMEFETHVFRRLCLISDPVSLTRGSGISATLIGMDYFQVNDPPKGFKFADIDHNLTDVEITSRNRKLADIKITICDQLNQPQYEIVKFNVPYDGHMTGDFNARGKLLAKKTYYKINEYTANNVYP